MPQLTQPEPIILGGTESGVDIADLFPGLLRSIDGNKGPSSADLWLQQDRQDAEEREALIRQLSSREPKF